MSHDLITLDILPFLQSSVGQEILAQLQTEDLQPNHEIRTLTQLRKTLPPQQARSVLHLAKLRQKATTKFGDLAQRMFFTSASLQQASHPLVRQYRAETNGATNVLDVCCGIGSDAIAYATAGKQIRAIDINPVHIELARLNALVCGVSVDFEIADAVQVVPQSDKAVFYDPARRHPNGKRIFDVEKYQPPLSLMKKWVDSSVTAKISPGVDKSQLTQYPPHQLEFISVSGELKEAVIHTHKKTGTRATLIHDNEYLHWDSSEDASSVSITEPQGWLHEPDPGVIRAGLVRDVATHFGATMIDESIAYISSDRQLNTPWVRSLEIVDWMPFQLKRVKAYLRTHSIGKLTIKKRGFPMSPEEIHARLKPKGDQQATLVFSRLKDKPVVIVCR